MSRKGKVMRSLRAIPVWLLIDAAAIFGALYLDMNVLPAPDAAGHPVFAVTIIAVILFGGITAIVLFSALVRILLWLILGDR